MHPMLLGKPIQTVGGWAGGTGLHAIRLPDQFCPWVGGWVFLGHQRHQHQRPTNKGDPVWLLGWGRCRCWCGCTICRVAITHATHVRFTQRDELEPLMRQALEYGVKHGLCSSGKEVIVCTSTTVASLGKRDGGREGFPTSGQTPKTTPILTGQGGLGGGYI
jgi:hypothetical protein